MFAEFHEPDLADRLRAAAAWPLAAFLFAQICDSVYPLLAIVPHWLLQAVRLGLLAGLVGGGTGGLFALREWLEALGKKGAEAGSEAASRPPFGFPVAGWLGGLIGGLIACAWTLK